MNLRHFSMFASSRSLIYIACLLIIIVALLYTGTGFFSEDHTNVSKISPFIERISKEERSLVGELKSFETLLEFNDPNAPKFDNTGFKFFDVEVVSNVKPFNYTLWFGITRFDADGRYMSVRDSHHQLLSSPYTVDPEKNYTKPFIDVYENVLQPTNSVSFNLSLGVMASLKEKKQEIANSLGLEKIQIFGKQTSREPVSLPNGNFLKAAVTPIKPNNGHNYELNFPPLSSGDFDLSSRGFTFTVSDILRVKTVKRNHSLQELAEGKELLIGSMHAQSFIVYMSDRKPLVFQFFGADSIHLSWEEKLLKVNVYEYDSRERTIRASQNRPNLSTGIRRHANLGITNKMPASKILMKVFHSNHLFFPTLQPRGNLASFAISEHADYNGVVQDNLTMFGNKDGIFVDEQGILGHQIPITKTIFPEGNNSSLLISNQNSGETTSIKQSNLADHPDYKRQLLSYGKYGDVEIGPHCVGQGSGQDKSIKGLINTLEPLDRLFNSVTWVDHGGIECLWETGWDPASPNYILPALKKYGYKFLNARSDKFGSSVSLIKDNEPGNILFYVPRFDDDLSDNWKPHHYTTSDIDLKEHIFTKEHFQSVVEERGFLNMHTYLPLAVLTAVNGKPALPHWYDDALKNLTYFRDKGDIFISTTSQQLDYVLFVRSLEFVGIDTHLEFKNLGKTDLKRKSVTFGIINLTDTPSEPITTTPNIPMMYRLESGITYIYPQQ